MENIGRSGRRPPYSTVVRVACWDLRKRQAEIAKALEHLRPSERRRLAGIVSAAERNRFLLGRYALRAGLSACIQMAPGQIHFRRNTYGQPRLACEAARGWYFSLSHAGDLVYVAIAQGARVGVDVERLRPRMDCESVGQLCLSETEQRQLRHIPAQERSLAFHRMWCGKEALTKATGKGMHTALHTVHVGVPRESGAPMRLGGWTVAELEAAPGYVAAVAVESAEAALQWMGVPG